MADMISGLNVIVVYAPKPVLRTWIDRLFSRPWRPWRAFRTAEYPIWDLIKDGSTCYQVGNTLYVSERQFIELQKSKQINSYL